MKRIFLCAPLFLIAACVQVVSSEDLAQDDGDNVTSAGDGTGGADSSGAGGVATSAGGSSTSGGGSATASGGATDASGGASSVGAGGDPSGSGGEAMGTGGGAMGTGGGAMGTGGEAMGTGGEAMGTGGGESGPCTEVVCGTGSVFTPTEDECYSFMTGDHGGWSASQATGCAFVFDGEPAGAEGVSGVGATGHTLEISGCTDPYMNWSCWD